eukprot:6182838-Amphidinium_carterae.1
MEEDLPEAVLSSLANATLKLTHNGKSTNSVETALEAAAEEGPIAAAARLADATWQSERAAGGLHT